MNNRTTQPNEKKHSELGAAVSSTWQRAKKIPPDFLNWVQLKLNHSSTERRVIRVIKWRSRRRIQQAKRALRRLSRRYWAEKVSTAPQVMEANAWANLSLMATGDNDHQYWQVDLPEHWRILAVRVLHPTSHTLSIEVDWDVEIGRDKRQVKTARRTMFIPGNWTVGDSAELVGQRIRVLVKPLIVATEPIAKDESPPRPLRAQRATLESDKGNERVEISDSNQKDATGIEGLSIDDEHRDTNIS